MKLSAATPSTVRVQRGPPAHQPPCLLMQNNTGMLSMVEINCKQGQNCMSMQRACAPETPITARDRWVLLCDCSWNLWAGHIHTPHTGLSFPEASRFAAARITPAWPSMLQGN